MTNEETLALLKPIMLDGTEKVGDKVYSLKDGDTKIYNIITIENLAYPLVVSGFSYTQHGYSSLIVSLPTIFKVNPFEWLNEQLLIEQRQNEMLISELKDRDNSQERVIEVKDGYTWLKRVLIKTTKENHALCWWDADSIEDAKAAEATYLWTVWRELPTKITKEEALKMLSEKGVDTTNLIIE